MHLYRRSMCLITRGSPIGDTRVTLRLTVGLARGPSVRGSWIAIDHRKLLLGDLWVSCGSFVGRQWARCGSPVGQQWVYGATSRVPRGGSQMDHPPVTREGLHVNDLKKLDSRPSRQCTIYCSSTRLTHRSPTIHPRVVPDSPVGHPWATH